MKGLLTPMTPQEIALDLTKFIVEKCGIPMVEQGQGNDGKHSNRQAAAVSALYKAVLYQVENGKVFDSSFNPVAK